MLCRWIFNHRGIVFREKRAGRSFALRHLFKKRLRSCRSDQSRQCQLRGIFGTRGQRFLPPKKWNSSFGGNLYDVYRHFCLVYWTLHLPYLWIPRERMGQFFLWFRSHFQCIGIDGCLAPGRHVPSHFFSFGGRGSFSFEKAHGRSGTLLHWNACSCGYLVFRQDWHPYGWQNERVQGLPIKRVYRRRYCRHGPPRFALYPRRKSHSCCFAAIFWRRLWPHLPRCFAFWFRNQI